MTDARQPGDPQVDLRDADERLAAWVDGELSGKDLERFEAELRVNRRLREQAEAYRRMVQSMQGALRQPMGRIDIADRVLAAVQQPAAAPRRTLLHPWLLSAVVAAGLVGAVWLMQGRGEPGADRRETAAAREKLATEPSDFSEAEKNWKKAPEAERDAGAGGGRLDGKPGDAGQAKTEGNHRAEHDQPADLQEDLRKAKDGPVPVATAPREELNRPGKTDAPQGKDAESAVKLQADDYFLGGKRTEEQAKNKEEHKVAAAGDKGPAAPEGRTDPARRLPAGGEPAPAPQTADLRQGIADRALSKRYGGFALDPATPSVPVMVLTRRGTAEELRRNLQQLPKADADKESARQQDRGVSGADQATLLARQFPSLMLAATSADHLQAPIATPGLQFYPLAVPDPAAAPFPELLDQTGAKTGNATPLHDRDQQARYRQSLQQLVPEGTRANALYVEGEASRVQDFLHQVSGWAAQNQLEVAFDDVPLAQVEMLEQTQLGAAQGQLVQGGGGKRGETRAAPTPIPAGPATPGPTGPATGGPAGPAAGGAAAAKVPQPSSPTQPQPPQVRAVLLLFREQAIETKR